MAGRKLPRVGGGRELVVGAFEVAAGYDAAAEARRLEAEARARAERAWAERQKQLAKDRNERQAGRATPTSARRHPGATSRGAAGRARMDALHEAFGRNP